MAARDLKQYTRDEVATHGTNGDLWIIVDAKVYDVTRFKNLHPGGAAVFAAPDVAGQDATDAFYGLHRHEVLLRPPYARLQIGVLVDEQPTNATRAAGTTSAVPYAEPTWLAEEYHTPYYKESHRRLQKAMRKFVDEVIFPDAQAREEDGKRPSLDVIVKMADVNIHAMRMGPGKHLEGRELMGGAVRPEEFDYFHELIVHQEIGRVHARGYQDGLQAGAVIGLSPVLNFGAPALRDRVAPDVLAGRAFIALAISEAFAGSDVAGLRTTARLDGKEWVVNGTKKWITNGMFADYFTVGCKTPDGFTVLLIERGEGVETKPIKTSYSPAAGTAFVTFDNVRVPLDNTLGKVGQGIFVMLSNFNHERWVMCCTAASGLRLIVEECLKWTAQRTAFGRPLNAQAVIRAKLAAMIARAESVQCWLENVTHQMCNMTYKQQADLLAGPIGLLKMYATRCAEETAQDAVQIFGGRGVTRTGMGRFVEQYHRTVGFDSLLGGAQDVLADLGVRQAMKNIPKNARL